MTAVEELLASLAYPGLAALCLFWLHVGVARWLAARRWCDVLLSATFVLLSLSTGLWTLLEFERLRLAIRLGWLVTLGFGIWLSVDFVRRNMRFSGSDSEQIDWHEMNRRLRKIEDALVTVQTVVNLLRDLLERSLPAEGRDDEVRDRE